MGYSRKHRNVEYALMRFAVLTYKSCSVNSKNYMSIVYRNIVNDLIISSLQKA